MCGSVGEIGRAVDQPDGDVVLRAASATSVVGGQRRASTPRSRRRARPGCAAARLVRRVDSRRGRGGPSRRTAARTPRRRCRRSRRRGRRAVGYAFAGATSRRMPPLRVRGHARRARSRRPSTPSAPAPPRRSRRRPPARARCASRSLQRGQRADDGEQRRRASRRSRRPCARRRPVGIAGGVADAAHRLADRAEAGLGRTRAGLAEARDVHEHDARVRRPRASRSRGPSRASVPGLKFSSTTSHRAAMPARRRRGRGASRRSIATDRLLRAIAGHQRLRPSTRTP